jgi:hypothetical protein
MKGFNHAEPSLDIAWQRRRPRAKVCLRMLVDYIEIRTNVAAKVGKVVRSGFKDGE